jgi:hypothetical protein
VLLPAPAGHRDEAGRGREDEIPRKGMSGIVASSRQPPPPAVWPGVPPATLPLEEPILLPRPLAVPFARPIPPWMRPLARMTFPPDVVHRGKGFDPGVSPTIFRARGLRSFFFSREEERMHVHVSGEGGEGKIWVEPHIEVVRVHGLSDRAVAVLLESIREREDEIRRAWNRHFGR